MFVRRSKYDALLRNRDEWVAAQSSLEARWVRLVSEINAKGGRDFLDNAKLPEDQNLTRAEVKWILQRAHPDKAGDSETAKSIFSKLTGGAKP